MTQPGNSTTGSPVDARGNPLIDPSQNVKELVEASLVALAKLRDADKAYSDLQAAHLKEIAQLRAAHADEVAQIRESYAEKLSRAESGRLDSIRQVDREEVAKTAVSANTAISTLAKQTTDLQQTLARQVTDTATAQEARNSAQYADTNKRLSALELSSSEGKGKQQVADPALTLLAENVAALVKLQAGGSGKSEGFSAAWVILLGAVSLIATLAGFAMYFKGG